MSKIDTVFESLKKRVRAREWKPDEPLPSRVRLSKEYGVSPATVAIAVRKLKEDGLLHVLPNRGAFIPETINGDGVIKPTIGLCGSYIPADGKPPGGYCGAVVHALCAAAQREYAPLLFLPGTSAQGGVSRQYCQAQGVRGVIFLGGGSYQEALDLRLEGFPVIIAHDPAEPTPLNFVDYDHAGALREIVKRFAAAGRRRIAVIFSSTSIPYFFRKLKPHFIDALYQEGLVYDIANYWRFVERSPQSSYKAHEEAILAETATLLDLPEPPTAIFYALTGLDRYAYVKLRQMVENRGLSIPGDIALACDSSNLEEEAGLSGFACRHNELSAELIRGIQATAENPFYCIQKLIPLPFIERGSINKNHSNK